MNAAGLILAAGAGTRFGDETKQLADLHGRPLLSYALEAMTSAVDRPYGSKDLGSKYQGQSEPTASEFHRDSSKGS